MKMDEIHECAVEDMSHLTIEELDAIIAEEKEKMRKAKEALNGKTKK